jgi:hypothetical protein
MKQVDLGQTISIFANIGVIAGIVFLGFELRQNQRLSMAETRSSIAETIVSLQSLRAIDPAFLNVDSKVRAGEVLTSTEIRQFALMQSAYWRYRENVSYQYRIGLYSDSEYFPQRDVWLLELSDEAVRSHWCSVNAGYSQEFVAELNALMRDPCS